MRTQFAAIAFVATLIAGNAGTGAGAAADEPTVRVGENRRVGAEPQVARLTDIPGIAVNPADHRHVVAVSENYLNGQCEHHVSFDAGATWTTGQLRAPAEFPSPPCPVFDSGGYGHMDGSVAFGSGSNVYTVFSSLRGNEGDSALVAKSTDGGRTFGVATVANPGGAVDQPVNSRPKLAVQPRPEGDRVIVESWLSIATNGAGPGKGYRASVTVSNDGAATWAAPVDASPLGQTAREIDKPVVGPDGAIHLAWKNQDDNSLWVAESVTGGTTWTSRRAVPPNGLHPRIAVDHTTGLVVLAYQTAFGPDVLVTRSSDRGLTWSAPVKVNDEGKAEKRLPQLAIAPNGRIDVLWQDRRHAHPGDAMLDYYYAYSTDGGQSFSTNHRVTDRSINTDVGTYRSQTGSFYAPALASFAGDALLAAWGDSREGSFDSGNEDVYFARIDLGGGAPVRQAVTATGLPSTSVGLSRFAYPAGRETRGTGLATKVVVVNEADLPSALSGAVLARGNFGPLLLAGPSGLPTEVKDEVVRLAPAEAFVVGDEEFLSSTVVDDLVAAGVARDKVKRMAGSSAAETAKLIATSLDTRSQLEKVAEPPRADSPKAPAPRPAFAAAIITNPATADAAPASALAASLRLPVLFVDRDAIPQATTDALSSLAITSTLVLGGEDSVADSVVRALPAPKRLADATAIALESVARGLPTNVVYLANSERPIETAVLGAAAARPGGLMLTNPGANPTAAEETMRAMGLADRVDRVVSLTTSGRAAGSVTNTDTGVTPQGATLPATGGSSGTGAVALAGLVLVLLGRRLRGAVTTSEP